MAAHRLGEVTRAGAWGNAPDASTADSLRLPRAPESFDWL
jgi:hypothetical protein